MSSSSDTCDSSISTPISPGSVKSVSAASSVTVFSAGSRWACSIWPGRESAAAAMDSRVPPRQ
jgi:hypothetical protein